MFTAPMRDARPRSRGAALPCGCAPGASRGRGTRARADRGARDLGDEDRCSPRRCAMRGRGAVARHCLAAAPLALHEGAVLAHEQIEVLALFVGELQEDLLAFRVLEALAVLFEKAM